MSVVVEKQVKIADYRAQQLERLAAARGVTQDALVEEALDLLFCRETDDWEREERELLQQLEAEIGPAQAPIVSPLNPDAFVVTHAVSISPEKIRRRGDGC